MIRIRPPLIVYSALILLEILGVCLLPWWLVLAPVWITPAIALFFLVFLHAVVLATMPLWIRGRR